MAEVKRIPFMRYRKIAAAFSITLVLLSLTSIAFQGLNFGLDFTGGSEVQVEYAKSVDIASVRSQLQAAGYDNVMVQNFGSDRDILMRLQNTESATIGDDILAVLQKDGSDVKLSRSEFVGPSVGEELREKGGLAMVLALIIVMIYIAFRFQIKFSVGAVAALVHDVIITVGFFSVTRFEVDLTVLAAVLAVIGYSLNDTIVVSDRIRENFRLIRSDDVDYIIDVSLTQTLDRTLMTSFTTMVVLLALLLVGGELNFGFSVALLVGIFIGTYSSVYVAANVKMALNLTKEDLMPPEKPKEDGVEEIPSWLKD
ncbi:protein translocase subunit SecF [Gynuella sunshinyii]|uniref:Protein-export membrane protein SecF n=1 Tax=Gynuella sunshinyii YC6258 TaxID=1445510 RepID=A0A0C5W082_9GAMM|nr:protein translocase subunit SecF [Gynuella sunshinyii]AJQ96089.1 preprotein translocase subunit SecF [Gynuella sunshinyii YC6258]